MKYIHIAVEFDNPITNLHTSLVDGGARNVIVRPTHDGWFSVKYEIQLSDPRVMIARLIEEAGAQSVGFRTSACGANFDFCIDDNMDEEVIRQCVIAQIKNAGYSVH